MARRKTSGRLGAWRPKRFPGVGSEAALRESFEILNDWARHLQDWENRVRAMCGILEVNYGLTAAEFQSVVRSVAKGKHSKKDIRRALRTGAPPGTSVGGASDVVGHPPDPPYTEGSI